MKQKKDRGASFTYQTKAQNCMCATGSFSLLGITCRNQDRLHKHEGPLLQAKPINFRSSPNTYQSPKQGV